LVSGENGAMRAILNTFAQPSWQKKTGQSKKEVNFWHELLTQLFRLVPSKTSEVYYYAKRVIAVIGA
jgi:hypothetical protein